MILSNYAIKFRTAVFVFIGVFTLAGISSYLRLPREGSPDITIPYVFITAVYQGTAPEEMEKLITIPMERQLNDVENVKEIRSTSAENVCLMAIEFLPGHDVDMAKQNVKDKVDLARPDLPPDLDEPIVDSFNISSDAPIFLFALSGATTKARLKNLAEDLQDQIEMLPGVKQAAISGTREREIRVEIDLPRLIAYEMPLGTVLARIAQENQTVSAGNIEMAGSKFQVRIPGEFEMAARMRDIVLVERDGRPIYLTDVAAIADTHKDEESIARVNGHPSVSIGVTKRTGENSVALIRQVKSMLKDFLLPPGIELTTVFDESDYVDMMIRELENNIATGFMLVVIVLLVFMGVRNSLFVALAIPMSLLVAFAAMSFLDYSLNMIVLFSLVLSVGMLVDNAIVIVENIYRNRTRGLTRREAARVGASEVAWPVITSTLTTLAAFTPLLFWPDIMGQFMSFLPRTLIVVLTASLFVAMVINPAVCSVLIGSPKSGTGGGVRGMGPAFLGGYERVLRGALRRRGLVLAIGVSFLVLTALIYVRLDRGVELFPETEPRNAVIDLKFPQGTSIERTDRALRAIEEKLPGYADVEFYLTTVGAAGGGGLLGGGKGSHLGSIHVEFRDAHERTGNTMELVERMRVDIGVIPGAELKVDRQKEGPPTGAPISIELSGADFDTLSRLASDIRRAIETVPGLVDVQDDLEDALPEIRFQIDRQRAAMLGLDTDAIGVFLRASIYGLEASRFRADEDEYDITVRLPEGQRNTINVLDEIRLAAPGGGMVPLTSLGEVQYTGGRGSIQRKDRKRVVTITGDNQGRGVDRIIKDVRQRVDALPRPRGYLVEYAGDTKEMQESFAFLTRAFAVAIGLILVILVIQFNSVILPAIIIFSVLLSLIGVLWGLLLCRMRFGVIMTGLGVISLAGIVVNNAIVLVDCIRQRCADGLEVTEAIVTAGRLRLRPVMLTAVTTILGLIPMAVGYSLDVHTWPWQFSTSAESSDWWAPMAVAVIFGLGVSTVLTLVLVPLMYSLADTLASRARRRWAPSE